MTDVSLQSGEKPKARKGAIAKPHAVDVMRVYVVVVGVHR